jgi:hypothetical protein
MNEVEDFTQAQLWTVKKTLKERWPDRTIEYKLADGQVRLNPADKELSVCPMLIWEVKGCNFVIIKTADSKFRCLFFYRNFQQYGTEKKEYDNIGDCLISLLKAQMIQKEKQNE